MNLSDSELCNTTPENNSQKVSHAGANGEIGSNYSLSILNHHRVMNLFSARYRKIIRKCSYKLIIFRRFFNWRSKNPIVMSIKRNNLRIWCIGRTYRACSSRSTIFKDRLSLMLAGSVIRLFRKSRFFGEILSYRS